MTNPAKPKTPLHEWLLMAVISAAILAASYLEFQWWQISLTETLGFATGGVCVWLNVRENIWNWPIGLANNVFFFVLFRDNRLYADMWLQVVYFGFGVYGWWQWLRGGANHGPLVISRTRLWEWVALGGFVVAGTFGMQKALQYFNGAAPFWDAHCTALSLAAQYLICRKRLENWLVWIAVDLISVPLFFSRDLRLTAVLYGIFLTMCVVGLWEWWKTWRAQKEEQP